MTQGLTTTFRVLAESETEAAARVLNCALQSSRASIAEAALVAILKRRNPAGQREILQRWDALSEDWKEVIRTHRDRMSRALRDAVLGSDPVLCVRGCRAAVWLRAYDLIPALLNALNEPIDSNADLIASTLLGLADQLYGELAAPQEHGCRDPQLVRQHVISSLETSVQRFSRHKRREVIEAFLLLVSRDNVTLKQVLLDPHHGSFLAVVDVLLKSAQGGVIRLLLSSLDDPHAPSVILSIVGNRPDMGFIRYLLRKIGREPAAVVKQNLKRITSIAWLRTAADYLEQLDDAGQHGAVQLIMASGIPRPQAFAIIDDLLRHGKPGGRRAAAEALAEFAGAEANALALKALDDPDPAVQASVLQQLRGRGIPGILPRLVDMLESPHMLVRQAARKSLAEFSFKRFLGAFDMLDEQVRHSTGMLVRKVDPQTIPLLHAEMRSRVRTRRMRALVIARAIDAVEVSEAEVLELLHDEDHLVRTEAALALGVLRSEASRRGLDEALGDRSAVVQEAAKKSLAARGQWPPSEPTA